MTGYTGFVDDSGGGYANEKFLGTLKAAGEAEGWVTLRYVTDSAIKELIMRGPGISGDQQIFVGFRAYKSVTADVYNISAAGFTGYVDANTFITQPGYYEAGIPAHNKRIDYWMNVNPQRFAFALKVGTPVYEHGYAGYAFPQATPNQFPYPMVVGGMLDGIPLTRYSDTNQSFGYRGRLANLRMRFVDGTWKPYPTYPWTCKNLIRDFKGTGSWNMRDVGGAYSLFPIIIQTDNTDVFARLDGVYFMTGFNRSTEDTATINGKNYILIQDAFRNDFADYICLEI